MFYTMRLAVIPVSRSGSWRPLTIPRIVPNEPVSQ